jgi:hypothetical protein
MNKNIKAGADIHAGDGGYSIGTKEKYDEFVKGRNQSLGKMQIRELMLEAGTDISGKWMSIDNAEKFAELIVRKCAGIAYGSDQPSRDIKEHFGVK